MNQTEKAVNIFNKIANYYQEKFMNVSLYQNSLDIFCNKIGKENASILDLACGPGNVTKYLLEKRFDYKILGTDLAPNMIQLAKNNNPSAQFKIMDIRAINNLESNFDGIICSFGLPYLSKIEAIKFICDASQKLNPKGVLYISTMEDDNSNSGFKTGSTGDKIYQNFHQEDYLVEALTNNYFEVINLERKSYLHNNQETTDLIIIAKLLK